MGSNKPTDVTLRPSQQILQASVRPHPQRTTSQMVISPGQGVQLPQGWTEEISAKTFFADRRVTQQAIEGSRDIGVRALGMQRVVLFFFSAGLCVVTLAAMLRFGIGGKFWEFVFGMPQVVPMALGLEPSQYTAPVPSGCQEDTKAINASIGTKDWPDVRQKAEAVLSTRSENDAFKSWLSELAVLTPILSAEHSNNDSKQAVKDMRWNFERDFFISTLASDSEKTGHMVAPMRALYAYALALHRLAGDEPGKPFDDQAKQEATRIMACLSEIRMSSKASWNWGDKEDEMLLIEGYACARMLGPEKLADPFEEEDAANQQYWGRLSQILDFRTDKQSKEHLRLEVWFWTTAGEFCDYPWNETVKIGAWQQEEYVCDNNAAAASSRLEQLLKEGH